MNHLNCSVIFLSAAILTACSVAPEEEIIEVPQPEPQPVSCEAEVAEALNQYRIPVSQVLTDANKLYVSGDFEAALLAYEKVVAESGNEREQLNALASLAKLRLLPKSPVLDPEAARQILDELNLRIEHFDLQHEYFGQVDLLESIQAAEAQLKKLQRANKILTSDLANKDEAIKRLKDLTVGGG